jgi:hypothetical protein
MKDFCKYCFNDPVTHNCKKELCGVCEMETEVAKRKSICFNCEHSSYCKNALLYDDESSIVMKGCSRFTEKHKQTRGDWLRSMNDEELAKWLVRVEAQILRVQPMLERFALEKDWLEWLQKECE